MQEIVVRYQTQTFYPQPPKYSRSGSLSAAASDCLDEPELSDQELLELLLKRSLTSDVAASRARHLIQTFGSFAETFGSALERLNDVGGLSDKTCADIHLMRMVTHRFLRGKVLQRPLMSCWAELVDYCRAIMAFETREIVRLVFLDNHHCVIGDEIHSLGVGHYAPVDTREIIMRCLIHNASALVLVHNHPSGDLTPSKSDIDKTTEIAAACSALDIELLDHFIISRNGFLSLRRAGLM